MRVGERKGHRHQVGYYGSDGELFELVVPFVREGIAAGEPVVVAVEPEKAELFCAGVTGTAGVSFLGEAYDGGPARTIKDIRRLLAERVTEGAERIRLVGEVPKVDVPWEWWACYEAASNHVYDEFPLESICLYDTRTTPGHILVDAARTHPFTSGSRIVHPGFEEPAEFVMRRPPTSGADPLESGDPVIVTADPTPSDARGVVRKAARGVLDEPTAEDFEYAVSEVVTNGLLHGCPPLQLRCWAGLDRLVVVVTDRGRGPADPFVGLLPTSSTSSAGMGLWLSYQLCSHLTLAWSGEGFTVRLVGGAAISTS